jgi:ribonuclease HII
MWRRDLKISREHGELVAGVDEVGRGSVCGPVLAAAYIPTSASRKIKVVDSKLIPAGKREQLFAHLVKSALDFSVGIATAAEIDELNILEATKLAMSRALRSLRRRPAFTLVDGNARLGDELPHETVVGGDNHYGCIAAASIIAKVTRDFLMKRYSTIYPGYFMEKNMGYGTREHLQALDSLGPSPIHRKSFRCVSQLKIQL